MRGKFIVFEGLDGAGKTTQIKLLAEKIRREGSEVFVTAEPTGFETGREIREVLAGKIRKNPFELAAMFVLDRITHNSAPGGISDMLESGTDIICDRYYYSNLAYQGYLTDYEWVRAMNLACPQIRKPDLCIFLDLEPEESLRRIGETRDGRDIYENLEALTRVRETFGKVIIDLKDTDNIVTVNTSAPIEVVGARIYDIYKALKTAE